MSPVTLTDREAKIKKSTSTKVVRIVNGQASNKLDQLATEEPLEIQITELGNKPRSLTVTMRTPGHDFELILGFLLGEGIISSKDDIFRMQYCTLIDKKKQPNVVIVTLRSSLKENIFNRNFSSTASCGLCGIESLQDLQIPTFESNSVQKVKIEVLLELPNILRKRQLIFESTGGLHAAGIFQFNGDLEVVREDIGRHNALDKVIGACAIKSEQSSCDRILVLSGRIGYELIQKAARARIPIIAAVSAPSSLAVEMASNLGITLVGFIRQERANVYSHPQRIAF